MTQTVLWHLLCDIGVISGVVTVLFNRFEKKLDKREKEKEEKEETKQRYEELNIRLSFASLSLAEATAEAVQRIPDAHCNGEMREALLDAKEAKKEYRDFEAKQTAKSMV